jgi:hypothetical protein
MGTGMVVRISLLEDKMKKAASILAVTAITFAVFAIRAGSQAKPATGFDRLKMLVGTWEAKTPEGETATSTIRLVSNATALEEMMQNSKDNQMVTLYSPDGDRVAVTHYCSAGNQPRMETNAVTGDTKEFDFSFSGITNLSTPASGHMHHLVIKIADNDHFSEQWTWRENDKDSVESIQFVRKS